MHKRQYRSVSKERRHERNQYDKTHEKRSEMKNGRKIRRYLRWKQTPDELCPSNHHGFLAGQPERDNAKS
jgi:hypothetical protein